MAANDCMYEAPDGVLKRIRDCGRVFIVAVAGDSGSGKTTFSRGIRRILGEEMVSSFSMDDYHSHDRTQRKELGITPLSPRANHLDLLADHLSALKNGETIDKPVYDHSSGSFAGTAPFAPTPVVVIEGLHPFYTPELRAHTDFKVFIDPSRAVKRRWKLRRDVGERGYQASDVMKEILVREPDYKLYVDVQKVYAEMVIKIQDSGFPPSMIDPKEGYSVRLIQQILDLPIDTVELSIDLSKIMRVSEKEFSIEFQQDDYYGKRVGIMTIDGEIHESMIEDLERKLGAMLGRSTKVSDRHDSYVDASGMAQLILSWRCLEKLACLADM